MALTQVITEVIADDAITHSKVGSEFTSLVYRQELRDWPSTDAFPDTKPIKP